MILRHHYFFWRCFVSLFRFSDWSKFHVNIIITGSGVMTIFFYKWFRNPEIGKTPVWVLPNVWRMGWVRDHKSGTNASNEMLQNTTKCQGYSFYRFWVIKGKPAGVKLPPPSTHTHTSRLGLKRLQNFKLSNNPEKGLKSHLRNSDSI